MTKPSRPMTKPSNPRGLRADLCETCGHPTADDHGMQLVMAGQCTECSECEAEDRMRPATQPDRSADQ